MVTHCVCLPTCYLLNTCLQDEPLSYFVSPDDTYLFPSAERGEYGLWIGADSFNWGSPAVITITAEWWAPGNPSPTPSATIGSSAT